MQSSIAFREGYASFKRGISITDNPHNKSPQCWHEWNRGYQAARWENK